MFKKIFCLTLVIGFIMCGIPCARAADSISAASAVLYQPELGCVLYQKDAYTRRAMASTTKIMTALLASEWRQPETQLVIPTQAFPVEGSSMGIRAGDHISLEHLITGLMLESGNDAANALAILVSGSLPAFAKKMNERAAQIGMKDTRFVTPSGLDAEEHYTTAYDMALLAAEALKNPLLAEIVKKKNAVISVGNPMHKTTVSNHNRLLSLYPYAIGMKTGFTKKAGRCLVSAAEKDGMLLIAVTLKAPDDWNDHMELYQLGYAQLAKEEWPKPLLPQLPVSGGTTTSISLNSDTPPAMTVHANGSDKLTAAVHLPPFVTAPVSPGQEVGFVVYSCNGTPQVRQPIVAGDGADARPVTSRAAWYWRHFLSLLTMMVR